MTVLARNLEPRQELNDLVPTASSLSFHSDEEPLGTALGRGSSNGRDQAVQEYAHSAAESTLASSTPDDDTATPMLPVPGPRVIPLPRIRFQTRSRFLPLQKWEGIVLSVSQETFTARLLDKTSNEADEEAEIPLSDVSGDDLALVQPGAVFYWTIGYSMDLTGSRRRVAEMRFRRLPAWTKREIEQARQDADRTIEDLGWND